MTPIEDLADLEVEARSVLPHMVWEYLDSGAGADVTVADNVAAWGQLRLRPRMLRDVSSIDTSTTVLGTPIGCPVVVAPTALHRMFHPDGEIGVATAAAGTVMVVSISASTSLEEIADAAPVTPRWLQLNVQRDRELTADLCARARETGCSAVVLTVDCAVTSRRPRNERAGFAPPAGIRMPQLEPRRESTGGADLFALVAAFDPSVTFDDIALVKEWSGLPIVVKGIVRGDDAARCVDAGADAIAVSNHGGRQLDGCIATAVALPEVVEAVGGQAEVYVDGGIRDGVDVVKALALGARAVMVGRPIMWGLATGGSAGVRAVLDGFGRSVERAMGLCGAPDVAALTPDLVREVPWNRRT